MALRTLVILAISILFGCEMPDKFTCEEAYDLIVHEDEQTKRYTSSFTDDKLLPKERVSLMFFPQKSGKYDLVVHFYAEGFNDTIPDNRAIGNQLVISGKRGSGDIQIPLERGESRSDKKKMTFDAKAIEESVISKISNMKIDAVDLLYGLYYVDCGTKNEISSFQKRLKCMLEMGDL